MLGARVGGALQIDRDSTELDGPFSQALDPVANARVLVRSGFGRLSAPPRVCGSPTGAVSRTVRVIVARRRIDPRDARIGYVYGGAGKFATERGIPDNLYGQGGERNTVDYPRCGGYRFFLRFRHTCRARRQIDADARTRSRIGSTTRPIWLGR